MSSAYVVMRVVFSFPPSVFRPLYSGFCLFTDTKCPEYPVENSLIDALPDLTK
jgi:hypothetical protein